jgi:hypothetical protein
MAIENLRDGVSCEVLVFWKPAKSSILQTFEEKNKCKIEDLATCKPVGFRFENANIP